ncbi:hypothetical protein F4801DRAFT_565813 [Xylaria longipes]|nr:hypothetical protein F4801DRAFT_565813 [Xylaria longipes]RYC54460.1 hypothetical protein CHU98_g11748 [Xylaria longipes]
MPSNSQSFSYSFVSTSTSKNGGAPQNTAYAERSFTDNNGTTTERMRQLPGQAPVYESSEQPGSRRLGGGASSTQNRITDVTDANEQQSYEEKMEDEYAKREGGA